MKLRYELLFGCCMTLFIMFIPPLSFILEFNYGISNYVINTGLLFSLLGIITYGVLYLKKKEKEKED